MPTTQPASVEAVCRSLAAKVVAYSQFAPDSCPEGLAAHAIQLSQRSERTALLGIAREVDTWLREILTPAQIALALAAMQRAGVMPQHIPVTPTARRLAAIAKRKAVRSSAEAELVQVVLATPSLAALAGEHLAALGSAFDIWQTKGRA
jgi:hypothetical protein